MGEETDKLRTKISKLPPQDVIQNSLTNISLIKFLNSNIYEISSCFQSTWLKRSNQTKDGQIINNNICVGMCRQTYHRKNFKYNKAATKSISLWFLKGLSPNKSCVQVLLFQIVSSTIKCGRQGHDFVFNLVLGKSLITRRNSQGTCQPCDS